MAAKWPENGAMEERSRDSAWRFGEIRRRSTLPMAQIGMAKVGAPSWYLRRSQWLLEMGDPVSYSERDGVSGLGEREKEGREEREGSEILWFLSFVSGLKPDNIILKVFELRGLVFTKRESCF